MVQLKNKLEKRANKKFKNQYLEKEFLDYLSEAIYRKNFSVTHELLSAAKDCNNEKDCSPDHILRNLLKKNFESGWRGELNFDYVINLLFSFIANKGDKKC